MNIDFQAIEEKLNNAPYEADLGIRSVVLEEARVSGKIIELLVVKLDPGKELNPHLHEHDEEICIALSEGTLILGRPILKGDSYDTDSEGKVKVTWDNPLNVSAFQTVHLPEKEAHFAKAFSDRPFYLMFYLPKTHHGEDRKFVVHP